MIVPPNVTTLLRAIASPSPATLDAWLTEGSPNVADIDWLQHQGLAPLVFRILATHGTLGRLDPAVAQKLRQLAAGAAAIESVRGPELGRVMLALENARITFILLKGSVLASTVYPEPSCRDRCDTDIWIAAEDHERARHAIAALGYADTEMPGRPHDLARRFGGEAQMVSPRLGQGLVELHFQAFVGEWCRLATAIEPAAVWARRVPFEKHGAHGAMMATEDQLLHLCVHFGINHQFSEPNLRAVLDLHLLAGSPGLDWSTVATRAREWRIATVAWTALSLAVRFFATPIPSATLGALRPGPVRRAVIRGFRLNRRILQGKMRGYSWNRGLLWLVMSDTVGSAMRFVFRAVFPEAEWLRARWDAASDTPVTFLRLRHWRSLLLQRRS